ncbi:MAG: peptide chain release factor N(5)-glutamine methyltransferase, partial [Ignavibacteria bacterium]
MSNSLPEKLTDCLNYCGEILKQNNIEDARLNAELMLCEVLRFSRIDMYRNYDKQLSDQEITIIKEYLDRRILREPLQYIIGRTSFYGLEFIVNKNVLIPRPETELLVEKLLKDIKESGKKKISVFEIGSGTGCISIALA